MWNRNLHCVKMILVVSWDVSRCVTCSSSYHTYMWSMWCMKQAVYSHALVVISLYWRGWPMLCGWQSVCFGVLLMCWVGEADMTKSMAKVKNKTEKDKHCNEANKKHEKTPQEAADASFGNWCLFRGNVSKLEERKVKCQLVLGICPTYPPPSLCLSFSESLCNECV